MRGGAVMKQVVIVADHSLVVHAIRRALRQTAGFTLGGFVDGRLPINGSFHQLRADLVLVDEMQHRSDALARLTEIVQQRTGARCLLLSSSMDDAWLQQAFDAGADAVVSKTVHAVALGTLLREISRGNVVHRFDPRHAAPLADASPLTEREREILMLVAEGYTNSRIAGQLWVTEQTVKFHLSNTYRKLGVANRTEASRYAHVHRLIPEPARLAS